MGEPEVEINAEVAEEFDVEAADERALALGEEEACTTWLHPGCATGDSSRHEERLELSMAALL